MEKLKLFLSKLFGFLAIKKTKEPKSTDVLIDKEPDSNFVGDKSKNNFQEKQPPVASPFVIKIENDLDISIEDFTLFSATFNDNDFDESGDLVKEGLIISSEDPQASYKKICENFKTNIFKIGLTYIRSEKSNQILESFIFKYQNANGDFFGKKIYPRIDPYQHQTTIIAQKTGYTLDENTSIIYKKIYPKTTLYIYLFPSEQIFDNSKNKNNEVISFMLDSLR